MPNSNRSPIKLTNALRYLRRALELDPSLRENAKDPEGFGWLVENDPQFAAEFRQLLGG